MYDSKQKSIESAFETSCNLSILYLPQILGLAMGYERKELGLNMNVVKFYDSCPNTPSKYMVILVAEKLCCTNY